MLNTKQGGLSNTQRYEHFNTRHDIAQADFEAAQDVPIKLNDQEQINYSNNC